jgi:hypothetical protein
VAGDRNRDVVCGASAGHGANGFWRAYPARDFGIGHGLPHRDGLQSLPHTSLKRRAAHVKRKVQTYLRRLDEADDADDHGLIVLVTADQPRLRKTILKIAYKFVRIVADQDRRHALVAGRYQYGSQRGLSDGETDVFIRPSGAILRGRHAEHVPRLLIEATRGVESRVVHGFRHAVTLREPIADAGSLMGRGIILRCQARYAFEQAMEVAGA